MSPEIQMRTAEDNEDLFLAFTAEDRLALSALGNLPPGLVALAASLAAPSSKNGIQEQRG